MIEEILRKVKSPFTDELIISLVEKYISSGCNDNLLYEEINNLGNMTGNDDKATRELINRIYSIGKSKSTAWEERDKSGIYYDNSRSWTVLYSNDDPMNENRMTNYNKIPLVYRFYLNLTGKEKSDFVLQYLNNCQSENIPFEFKFSNDDSRNDQIIILTSLENFEKNFAILEELTRDKKLGEIPMLIGKHDNGIGVTEEYHNRLYSPTKVRLALIRSSVKKYLCDHKEEFYNQLTDEEKKEIDSYLHTYDFLVEREEKKKNRKGNDYRDSKKKYYQKISSSIARFQEHIDDDNEAYCCGDGLLKLGNAVSQIYSNNPQQFLTEIVKNYRMIGTQVWGFSQDLVFSNETEERFLKEFEKLFTAKEINADLCAISREGLTLDVEEAIIDIANGAKEKSDNEQSK